MNFNEIKKALNQNNGNPYSDEELKEIIELLESLADVTCDFLLKTANR